MNMKKTARLALAAILGLLSLGPEASAHLVREVKASRAAAAPLVKRSSRAIPQIKPLGAEVVAAVTAQDQLHALAPAGAAPEASEAAAKTVFEGSQAPAAGNTSVQAGESAAGFSTLQAHQRVPLRQRLIETAELGRLSLGVHTGAGLVSIASHAGAAHPFLMAAVWVAGAGALVGELAGSRSTVVGGWQASHDQKYRVGSNGELHDVRGHKYGQDRYEEYAPGRVSPIESGAVVAASVAMGLPWLNLSNPLEVALYLATAAGLLAVQAALRGRKAGPSAT